MNIKKYSQLDFSLGVQSATTWLLKKPNELQRGINLRFTESVGGFERRPGFVRAGNTFASVAPQGGHIAKFSNASKRLVAVNNSGATATIIRVQDSGNGSWSDVLMPAINQVPVMTWGNAPTGVASASSEFQEYYAYKAFDGSINSGPNIWIANSNTGWLKYDFGYGVTKVITSYSIVGIAIDRITSANQAPKSWSLDGSNDNIIWVNIDTQTNADAWTAGLKRTYTTNNAVAYRYYRIVVNANQGSAYYLEIAELELLAAGYPLNSVIFFKDYLDEVYVSGFNPATGDPIQPININKDLNVSTTRNLLNCPFGYFFQDFLGVLYIANVLINTNRFKDRVYKASPPLGAITYTQGIQTAVTEFKVDSVRYLKVGMALDIYRAGTETKVYDITITAVNKNINTITSATTVTLADNDEIWLDGRKGLLSIFWNVDYPNPQATGEFLTVKPGTDASPTITGIGASSNRMFIWTRNSGTRWDGQNLVTFNNSVGCISHRSIANIDDDWLIWVDAKGNIRARNETASQQENISRAIRNTWMRKLTLEQLKAVSAGIVDQTYKLYLGTINGEYIRVCYDFDANTWSPERLGYPALIQAADDYTGVLKPYFFSSNGRLYMDEQGDLDDDKNIAMEAGTGQDMLGTEQVKRFYGIKLFSRNCNGLRLQTAVDGDQMKTIGRIEGEVCFMKFPEQGESKLPLGTTIDWQVMGVGPGEAPKVDGAVVYYVPEEDVPNEQRRS